MSSIQDDDDVDDLRPKPHLGTDLDGDDSDGSEEVSTSVDNAYIMAQRRVSCCKVACASYPQ